MLSAGSWSIAKNAVYLRISRPLVYLQIGKVVHITADLAIVSAFLAGVKRNTGLTPNFDSIQSEDLRYYSMKYLDVGEKIFDYTAAYLGGSSYFKRK